ncbi:S-adenosyl-L-methionine-dependent methyltransferase [Macrolepiota fuliginosa MF-IS2]|uniref:S-adenosyl-L-methionine-dependent methyltransferase n=1 Tax=Macrolepiota fuliginosa MF-IS2 TaxID=1400762 RepID=A0A9P6C6C6_9AGAR|nr:S-adenosyl-L-methionine-dependent methyltransferase [Macrolepiota fuliginosa MF-IS2]
MNFYFDAAKTLDRLDAKEGSIKGIIATLPEKTRKRTSALVIETLKYKSVLTDIIQRSELLKREKKIRSTNLALILVHDLLLAGGIQAGDGPIKQAILRHKTRLNAELTRLKIKQNARSTADLAQQADARASQIPRYVRVNTKFWKAEEAIKYFTDKGFSIGNPLQSSTQFNKDEHIPDLLRFAPQTSFQDEPAYTSGKIILQDKASCFPAYVLRPPVHDKSIVIDATAAPGNKTSHLSALMKGKGKLYAFERDRKRFGTLKMMLSKAACANVEPINADFLTTDPADPKYEPVTHILLDPSCSGSGIVNRLDHLLSAENDSEDDSQERLNKLATFQLKMIKHAMRFANAQRIVYSTCSIHAIENERVVSSALASDEAISAGFILAPRDEVLPAWHRRGYPEEMQIGDAASVVRCLPGEDATNGFFVSCFIRKSKDGKRKAQHQNTMSRKKRKSVVEELS